MEVDFVSTVGVHEKQALALLCYDDLSILSAPPATSDAWSMGPIARAMAATYFSGAVGEGLEFSTPPGTMLLHLSVRGGGRRDQFDELANELVAADALKAVARAGASVLTLFLDPRPSFAARAALGASLAAYRFDRYQTKVRRARSVSVSRLEIVTSDPAAAQASWSELRALLEGVTLARDLVSEPPNVLFPEEFARRAEELATIGLDVEVLDEAAMRSLGMGALLSVGAGSARTSKLVIIRWTGADDRLASPLAFVGKGVCFDSGGLSLKLAAHTMEDMKFDMGGAAAVAGLMHTLATRKARVNAVGILGLVENMPDGSASRPGDVVTSLSGQTIEIVNTDAEGRLVLADALWYCNERFKPRIIIDVATLTGSMDISLGHDLAGMFANNETLSDHLLVAGIMEQETLWRMPLQPSYEGQLDSPIADLRNVGESNGRSITAALFLQRFVVDTPWAHIDINPVVWRKNNIKPTCPIGATGFGVRLLNRMILENYEDR